MDAPTGGHRFGRNGWRRIVLVVVVGLLLPMPWLVAAPAGTLAFEDGWPTIAEPYVFDATAAGTLRLTPLDPCSLADDRRRPAFTVDVPAASAWTLSESGTALASIDGDWAYGEDGWPEPTTIVVRNGLTGPTRVRFRVPLHLSRPRLSRDGSRLVAQLVWAQTPQPEWYVFDTATGRLLTRVRGDGQGPWTEFWVDPIAWRLYRLLGDSAGAGPTPPPVSLVAYDLHSGAEMGRLALPELVAGESGSDRVVQGRQVPVQLSPGVALSPDGRRLAIVHADRAALTLVDTGRLAVERTVALTRPRGLAATLIGLLRPEPQVAEAAAFDGAIVQAVFAPDGQHLFVFGVKGEIDGAGDVSFHGLGLRRVDVASGEIVAEALPEATLDRVVPSPDGTAVYVVGPELGSLRRLDAATLATRAERRFDGPGWLEFLPPVDAASRRPAGGGAA